MKALVYRKTGPASEVLEVNEIDKPIAKKQEVLVKVYASGINPTDTKTRAGIFPIQGAWDRIIPHHDAAGVIEAVGEGVPKSRIGERVWVHSAQWRGADGTAAEFVVVPSRNALALPDAYDFADGATFGVPLLTAYHAVTLDGSPSGKTLLVQGGAGAVGNYAIQIARAKGAKVIATVSSDEKRRAAEAAGAASVINYKSDDVEQRVRELTDGQGVDQVVEVNLSANAMHLPGLVKSGAFVSVYGSEAFTAEFPAVGAVVQQMRLGFFVVFALPPAVLKSVTAGVTKILRAGEIEARLSAQMPLSRGAEAHDKVDDRTTIGNVVLIP